MITIWLAALCGLGCLCAAGSAVLLSGQRRPAAAFGGSLAFLALLLVLVCAGIAVTNYTQSRRGSSDAERLLDQIIERETR